MKKQKYAHFSAKNSMAGRLPANYLKLTVAVMLMMFMLVLTGCGQQEISNEELQSQLNEFIREISADGTLDAIEDHWFSPDSSSETLDFSGLTGENGTIIFGTKTSLPFSFKNKDSYSGIVPDIMLQFCREYGYRIEIMDFSDTNSMVLAVSAGKCHVAGATTSVTEERKQMIDYSEPYFDNNGSVVMNIEDADSYTEPASLAGKRIGVATGSIYHGIVSEKIPDAIVSEYNTNADLCQALQLKKVDAIVDDLGIVSYSLQNYPTETIVGSVVDNDRFAFIFPKLDSNTAGIGNKIVTSLYRTLIENDRWKQILQGIGTTLLITVVSILAGIVLGFGLCMAYRRNNRFIIKSIDAFSWLIRGLPTVVLLLIMYYIVFGSLSVGGTVVSIVSFSLIFAVTVCGLLQSGIRSIDRGQFEACTALGYREKDGFRKIILPQVIRFSLPGFKSEVIALIKATSIVGYIAVQDLTKTGDIIRSSTYEAFAPLILTAIIYFILAWLLTKLVDISQSLLDRKSSLDHYLKGVKRNAGN